MSFRYKSNGARLRRLIIDVGSETIRMFFDSICPPPNLKAILNNNRPLLDRLHSTRVIRDEQMKVLFPPEGMTPTTSKDYDIMLLFVLLRNIPFPSADEKPTYTSKEADLVRIKDYINEACNHRESMEVNDHDFRSYWDEISAALKRLGASCEDIENLKTSPIDEDYYTNSINMFLKNTTYRTAQLIDHITPINKVQRTVLRIVLIFLTTSVVFLSFQQRLPSYLPNEPDYSYPQNVFNPGFVGREWVFRQIELDTSNTRGVLLVADPGWGKSAIMRQLISSSSSSAVIHKNIIGYHFCKYNDKSTRDGGRFVKNLTQLIGKRVPKYKEIVNSKKLIQDTLKSNCNDNPVRCFQVAIVEPLLNLNSVKRNTSFILIDGLDECLEKEERYPSIVNVLYRNVPDLPDWVKVIIATRNQPVATSKMSKIGLSTLKVDVDDQRNENDLRIYAAPTVQYVRGKTSSKEEVQRMEHLIDHALKFSKGNFLYLETIINYWRNYPNRMNTWSIPESLADIYATSFVVRFKFVEFGTFEPFLEILLASNLPLELHILDEILNHNLKGYNTRKVATKLSEYFKSDIHEGPVQFHHQFLAEWLANQTSGIDGIFIQKSRGHRYIANYLFHFYDERPTNITYEGLSELCTHVLHGKLTSVSHLRMLGSMKVSEVRDSRNRSVLHDLALKRKATKILAEFIKQFNSVDILDYKNRTPAMYAVKAGNYENMKLFINNGANVNHTVKRSCVLGIFLTGHDWDDGIDYNMIFLAVFKGYTKIATLLIEKGAEIEKADECGRKGFHVAAVTGQYEFVRLYISHGVQPDLISLHHAAARNHTEIVRLLLDAGLRDECLPCKSENTSWCVMNLDRFHLCFCETALYAAVSRNNLEMAKLILQYGNTSVNCRHGSGRTALMEAFSQKNIQMVELLINAGANISAECESPLTDLVYDCSLIRYKNITVDDLLYSLYCSQYVCDGNRVIDFSFAYGLWEVMATYISNIEFYSSFLNVRWNPLTVAAIYDQVDFIKAMYGSAIKYIKTLLRNAVVCRSVRTLAYILGFKGNDSFTIEYKDGKTLLHLAILGSKVYVCRKLVTHADIGNKKRLKTVKLLTMVPLDINKQDKYGRTALHYAVIQVLPKIVKHLVKVGAHWRMKDKRGDTALEYAIRERPYLHNELLLPCQWTSDYVFEVCQSTVFDKLASYLLRLETITKCDVRAKKLLDGLLHHRLPLSLYSLFDFGLDVNCAQRHFRRVLKESVFDVALNLKYREIREVFKIFKINVHVTCDLPFAQSELHLMAYLRSFRNHDQLEMVKSKGNLFQPTMDGSPFPLQRFISSNPDGVKILNKCYDKEGYLAIHRAVQGKVLDAVSWFVENGVDINTKTKTGLTALDFAIYNLPGHHLYNVEGVIFKKLLDKMQENGGAFFRCNTKHVDLSPLHVAASRGITLMELIHDEIPGLPLNCTNSDGIRPIYLAHLYHATDYFFRSDRQAFRNLNLSAETGPSKFPQREVEYHLIYNQFYRTPQGDLRNALNDYELFGCPGINELLPHKTEIQRRITVCTERCLLLAFEACRQFSCSFPNLNVQNIVWNASSHNFMDITAHISKLQFHLMKKFPFISMSLWRNVTKAHSCAQNCSCFEVMLLLQERFTSDPREDKNVGKFVAERMRWTDTSRDGDVKYRWPFGFLLKKALKKDKAYEYLKILSPKEDLSSYSKSAA